MRFPDFIPAEQEHLYPVLQERVAGRPAQTHDYLPYDSVTDEAAAAAAAAVAAVQAHENRPSPIDEAPHYPQDFYEGLVNELEEIGKALSMSDLSPAQIDATLARRRENAIIARFGVLEGGEPPPPAAGTPLPEEQPSAPPVEEEEPKPSAKQSRRKG